MLFCSVNMLCKIKMTASHPKFSDSKLLRIRCWLKRRPHLYLLENPSGILLTQNLNLDQGFNLSIAFLMITDKSVSNGSLQKA